jgi:hypothetical protein
MVDFGIGVGCYFEVSAGQKASKEKKFYFTVFMQQLRMLSND